MAEPTVRQGSARAAGRGGHVQCVSRGPVRAPGARSGKVCEELQVFPVLSLLLVFVCYYFLLLVYVCFSGFIFAYFI